MSPPPPSSSSWNLLGTKIAVGVMLVGAIAWICYYSFYDLSENIKNREKKDSQKNNQEPQKLSKNDDTKGISPDDLKAALKKKVTKDGDCISCRELPTTPKKKTPKIPLSSAEGTPPPAAAATLPGLNSTLTTPKDADKSFGSTSSTNSSWDVLPLPTTPKKKEKNGRDVPPTPANSLTILLKNRKKREPNSEGATISSSDTRSGDKEEEKTQDDL